MPESRPAQVKTASSTQLLHSDRKDCIYLMRKRRLVAIYPEYLDASRTRCQGRRVPQKHAVKEPTLKKIRYALNKLELEHYPEPEKSYSRSWWEQNGRMLVDKSDFTKEQLLVQVAMIARRLKSTQEEDAKKKQQADAGSRGKQKGKRYSTQPKVRKRATPTKQRKKTK